MNLECCAFEPDFCPEAGLQVLRRRVGLVQAPPGMGAWETEGHVPEPLDVWRYPAAFLLTVVFRLVSATDR